MITEYLKEKLSISRQQHNLVVTPDDVFPEAIEFGRTMRGNLPQKVDIAIQLGSRVIKNEWKKAKNATRLFVKVMEGFE